MKAVVAIAIVIGMVGLAIVATRAQQDDHEKWLRYRDAHHCQPVRQDNPPAGIGTAPGKTVWQCDFGETFVRDTE